MLHGCSSRDERDILCYFLYHGPKEKYSIKSDFAVFGITDSGSPLSKNVTILIPSEHGDRGPNFDMILHL